jgi:hypothetical protein
LSGLAVAASSADIGVARRRESLGVSHVTVSEPMMEQFTPVAYALADR